MKTLAERSVMERVVLLLNHVISAEPQAMERLRAHAARTLRIELEGWPALLPAPSPIAFRVTPPGLVEWIESSAEPPPDLRVAIDASNPALAFAQVLVGERPQLRVDGDAAFATDVNWLIDNLRWDVEDDLARLVGDAPAREIARFGNARRQGDPRGCEDARRLRPARRPRRARRRPPSRRPDEAPRPADLHLRHGSALRAGRARAVELSPALGPCPGAGDDDRPHARGAARRAPAPRPGDARPDLRQVRPGAVDAARPAAGRHRRRTRQAAGPGAAVPGGAGARDWSSAPSAGRSRASSPASRPSRSPAPRSRRCTSRC